MHRLLPSVTPLPSPQAGRDYWQHQGVAVGPHIHPRSLIPIRPSLASLPLTPSPPRLAVATGSTKVYLWTPEGASCVHIPLPSFRAFNMRWHPNGTSIILADRTAICCAYLTPSETPTSTVETPIAELLDRASSKEEASMVEAAATAVAVN